MRVKIYSFISYTASPSLFLLPPPSLSLIVRMAINTVKLINVYGTLHHTQLRAITIENTRYSSEGKYINEKYRRSKKLRFCHEYLAHHLRNSRLIVGL